MPCRGFEFLPAGRILAGAGTGRAVTLFNCFVMGTHRGRPRRDLREREGGRAHHAAGRRHRPRLLDAAPEGRASCKGVGADASGPVSFMDVWDAMCRTIMSAGARRGAMMGDAALRSSRHRGLHRRQGAIPTRLRNVQSVGARHRRLHGGRARADAAWELELRRQGLQARCPRARCGSASCARPTTTPSPASSSSTASTREQSRLLRDDPRHQSLRRAAAAALWRVPAWARSISRALIERSVHGRCARSTTASSSALTAIAVRFLDNVIDVSNFPLAAQRKEAQAKRRIGLGVTGLADALIFCGVALRLERGGRARRALDGAHPERRLSARAPSSPPRRAPSRSTTRERFCRVRNVAAPRPRTIRARDRRHGMRNGLLTSIAPTGTISLFAGNVSSGIEPVFDLSYRRRVLGRRRRARARDGRGLRARALPRAQFGAAAPLPDCFRQRADDLTPREHLAHAGGAAAPCRQRDLQDHQLPGGSPSRPSRTSISRPMRSASRAAPPTAPTR